MLILYLKNINQAFEKCVWENVDHVLKKYKLSKILKPTIFKPCYSCQKTFSLNKNVDDNKEKCLWHFEVSKCFKKMYVTKCYTMKKMFVLLKNGIIKNVCYIYKMFKCFKIICLDCLKSCWLSYKKCFNVYFENCSENYMIEPTYICNFIYDNSTSKGASNHRIIW